jgi:transposase
MAIADASGLPVAVSIADGPRHEVKLVEQTLAARFIKKLPRRLIGDRAYDSAILANELRCRNIELISPLREREGRSFKTRHQDARSLRRYKKRWLVERLFSWLLRFRRLVTRWEPKAENFLGFLHLGCIRILLRRL